MNFISFLCFRDEARRQGILLGVHRQRILLEVSKRNMNTITAAKCAGWFSFMQTYIPRCFNREHIEGLKANFVCYGR